jgi:hypothetical protein
MRKQIYICDQCKAVLSDKTENKFKEHISIEAGKIGWVETDDDNIFYNAKCSYAHAFLHFCNEQCLAKHFKKAIKK